MGRPQHMAELEAKVRDLKCQVRQMQLDAERKNRELYASRYFVGCTGCWPGGPVGKETLTEADVVAVETMARRLREWWEKMEGRRQAPGPVAELNPPKEKP